MKPKDRTDHELWQALENLDDPLDARTPSASVDALLRKDGIDPEALADEGARFVAALAQKKARPAWQEAAQRKKEAFARLVRPSDAGNPSTSGWAGELLKLSRDAILSRLDALRTDPRFGTQIATAFHKRKPEESSDEELRALLEDMEDLRALGDGDGGKHGQD